MRVRTLAYGGTVIALACGFFACNSGESLGPAHGGSSGPDSGSSTDAGPSGGPASDAGTVLPGAGDAGGGGGGDSGPPPNCHPPSLYAPPADAGVYCIFSGTDGGNDVYCSQATQQCCESPSDDAGASTCNAVGTVCPVSGAIRWQCEDTVDCATGNVCCAALTLVADPACGYFRAGPGFSGTTCKPACAAGEMVVCQQPSSCKTGTCTPFRAVGNSVGACK